MGYRDVILAEPSLLAYWRLDDTGTSAVDSSGNGHTGTLSGSGITKSQPGAVNDGNTSMLFDGAAGTIALTAINIGADVAMSLGAWVRRNVNGVNHGILTFGSQSGYLRLNTANKLEFLADQVASKGVSTGTITDSNWHFCVVTYAGAAGTVAFYIDGLLSGSAAATGAALTAPTAAAAISQGGINEFFNGTLDEVMAFSSALTAAQVAAFFAAARAAHGFTRRPMRRAPRRLPHRPSAIATTPAGAAAYTQSLDASSASLALMQRDASKIIVITSASAPAIGKAASKSIAAVSPSVATAAKQLPRALSASTSSAAVVTKRTGKSLTASSATQASFIRNVTKFLIFTSPAVAVIGKAVTKTLSVASASSASLLASRLFLRALSATSTVVAALLKQVNKPLTASSASVVTLKRAVTKTLSLTSAALASMLASKFYTRALTALSGTTATLLKQVGKPLSATSASASSIGRAVGKTVSAISPAVASIVKRTVKNLSATSASVTSLVAQRVTLVVLAAVSASVATIARAASKTIVTSAPAVASLVKNVRKTLTAASGSTATIIKQRSLTIAAVSTTIASFGARAIGKALSTTSTTSTTIKRSTSKTLGTVSAAVPSIVVSGAQSLFKTLSAVANALVSIVVRFFPRTTYPPPVLIDSAIATLALTDEALPNYRNIVMAPNPTAYWRLGDLTGLTVDEVGARPGTVIGGVVRGVSGGQIADNDPAMTFDGSTGYIDLGANGIDLSAGDWTISALVNPIDFTVAWHQILSGGQYSYGIGVTTTDFRVTIMTQADAPASGYMPPLGVWTRLGATFIKATGQLTYYVNGVPIRVVTFNTAPAVLGVKSRYIGGSGVMYPNWWHGGIDELVVYPYALPPAAMLAQHELGVSGFGAVVATDLPSASVALADVPISAQFTYGAAQDIGVTLAGGSSYANGVWTITGDGNDIWDAADAFRYVYQPIATDGMLVARVISQTNSNGWAKAGIMVRTSTDPGSPFFLICVTPGHGLNDQWRLTQGGGANYNPLDTVGFSFPIYLRMARVGATITASYSTDGVHWTQMGAPQILPAGPILIGLAVTSHDATLLSTAIFDSLQMYDASASPTYRVTTTDLPVATVTLLDFD